MSENKNSVFKLNLKDKLKLSAAKKNKTILRSALVLLFLALSVAVLLAGLQELVLLGTYENTHANALEVMARIYPATEYRQIDSDYEGSNGILAVYEAYNGQTFLGYCVEVEAKDHTDKLSLVVAVDTESKVAAVEVLSMSENAGTGIKVKSNDFLSSFVGKKGVITAVKGEVRDSTQISVISGATISSRAVTEGINHALAAVSQIEAEKVKAKEVPAA